MAHRVVHAGPWPSGRLDLTDVEVAVRDHPVAAVGPFFDDSRHSAVMVALRQGLDGAEVLLTKRSVHLSSHRGEISFPGGRLDPEETFEDAARREAHEEVALDPAAVRVLGRLDPLNTLVSRSYIVPVVGALDDSEVAVGPASTEVERVMWVPLGELTRPDTYREERWGRFGAEHPIFFFELDDETVWGATARVLHQLLSAILGPPQPAG